MYKILISGYYGFNNIGDESILLAVVNGLKTRLDDIEITVLSRDPENTANKYNVKSVDRKSVKDIFIAVKRCDLIISGGGSLLQDVTSKKSIWYYLMLMKLALLMRKKVFIYSQGMGPINSKINRWATARTLRKVSGIVVRDEASKEMLAEIGVPEENVIVTADPVLRVKQADKSRGRGILMEEGFKHIDGKITVGWAIKERKVKSSFVDEVEKAMRRLIDEYDAQIVLIPFHYDEDIAVIDELQSRLGNSVYCLKHKYLTNEMLSIIGNMDVLVGVRLHSLIYAAIMDVPMIAVSYDPKINSFMKSIGMKAMCSVYDFNSSYFIEEFEKTIAYQNKIKDNLKAKLEILIRKLDTNEEMIRKIMKGDV